MMKKKTLVEILLHLVFWAFTFYYFTNNSFLRYPSSLDPNKEYYSLLLIIAVIYSNYFWLIPHYFTQQKLFKYFFFLLSILLLITTLEFLMLVDNIKIITSNLEHKIQMGVLRFNYFGILFRDTLFVGFFTMFRIYRDAIEAYKLLTEKTAMEKQQLITQINMVKSKVNTHFFFNTLNSIYSLALDKSDKTPDIVLNLSDLMEYVVSDSENEWVPLDSEIRFIQNYIALEKVRHLNMNLNFDIKGETFGIKVPPMIFESFVNNAFKYTDINNNGFINICIECKNAEIIFDCENSVYKMGNPTVKSTGKGMNNTYNRLNLHYKDKYQLEIINEEDKYKVNLLLKCK
ncbi:MAG: sensor histidine kinase [Bacteroidales bacterium]